MIYKSGLYLLSPEAWEDGGRTFEALLIDDAAGLTFDIDDAVVNDIVAAELTTTGVARCELASRVASWDAGTGRWRYQCTSPTFGAPEAGDDAAGWIISEKITDDSDSPLVLMHEFASPVATDGNTFTITVTSAGVAYAANESNL